MSLGAAIEMPTEAAPIPPKAGPTGLPLELILRSWGSAGVAPPESLTWLVPQFREVAPVRDDRAVVTPTTAEPIVTEPEPPKVADDASATIVEPPDRFMTDTTLGGMTVLLPEPSDLKDTWTTSASPIEWTAPAATASPVPERDWPSARQIFESHRARQLVDDEAAPRLDRTFAAETSRSYLTEARAPDLWRFSAWWVALPAAILLLVLGVLIIALAATWAADDLNAGLVANQLALGQTIESPPLPGDPEPPSQPSWWRSKPGNLVAWALALDQSATRPEQVEQIEALLTAARQASPAQGAVRFAAARPIGDARAASPLYMSLGLSRDVVALAWTGHQLLVANRKESALWAYRSALSMASAAECERLGAPSFIEDPQVGRYTLPGEDLIAPIVRDLAEHGGPYAQWSGALPKSAVVALAAIRVLRERTSPDADTALDALLAGTGEPSSAFAGAAGLAARAEAHALRSQWAEAEESYRQALDLMPDGSFRRSWFVNLAEIEKRLGNDTRRREALEAAKGTGADAKSEISRRAAELLKLAAGRPQK
jgi:hypothetical protein